jgi:sirohydrochlorin cobaltochelatase
LKEGLILFAHGSRDPEWARPFEKLAGKLGNPVRLAYLEHMRPSLDEAIAELVALGVDAIRVVPVFLGFGGHVKQDLPQLVAAANPKVRITIDPPVGEDPRVIDAIAAAISNR